MFDTVAKWLTGAVAQPGDPDALQLAIVVLLVQAAQMDDHFDESERTTIGRLLAARFGLTPEHISRLVETAEQRAEASNQLLPFTRLVVERLSPPERVQVVEMLYEVVYADGTLDPDEDALVRRIAGLIYVPDFERGAARKRARRTLGLPD
jgi:uncharacterized tellurite resistance protein B-like protein